MSELSREPQPNPIIVDEKLPGILVSAEEQPEGLEYRDQVIESPYGNLYYAPDQRRDGMIRWVTNHGEVCIRVRSGTGEVVDIDTETQEKHSGLHSHVYRMGMQAYQDLKRRIAAGENPADLA